MSDHDGYTIDVGYVHVLTEPGGPCEATCPHPDHRPTTPGLLDNYDPVPGLVARGVMSDEHDPDSCEADCCTTPGGSNASS